MTSETAAPLSGPAFTDATGVGTVIGAVVGTVVGAVVGTVVGTVSPQSPLSGI
jgi:tetrahydromethanopterin S-methyltransferase subunit C